ncbi:MAG: alcohol dehydrogenase, partial [Alphaproteobacteria bacterium]|nr:alcohol dehydrogenase [Alphaproteobacteria bacterium]
MRAMQIIEWGKPLELREYPTPEPQGKEVLVRVTACGVCHSDLHIWSGHFDLGGGERLDIEARGVTPPFTMGHEPLGTVEALGPEAEGVAVGESYIVYPWIGCGACEHCQDADTELLCATPRVIGTRVDGGYADYVIVPDAKYLVDYTGVSQDLACTYACSGLTAYSALRKIGELTADDYLVTIGAGGVGLSAVHFASAVTPAKVITADVDGTKRAAARQVGAHDTIDNAEAGAVEKALEMTGGGAAATIDFVGRPETSRFGVDILRKGGRQVQVGLYGEKATVPLPFFPLKMISMIGSYVGSLNEMHELMALVKAGRVPPIPVEARPLEAVNSALD